MSRPPRFHQPRPARGALKNASPGALLNASTIAEIAMTTKKQLFDPIRAELAKPEPEQSIPLFFDRAFLVMLYARERKDWGAAIVAEMAFQYIRALYEHRNHLRSETLVHISVRAGHLTAVMNGWENVSSGCEEPHQEELFD